MTPSGKTLPRAASGARRPVAHVVHPDDCDPSSCPCDDAECSLSKYVRATTAAADPSPTGEHTLEATEQAVAERLAGLEVDMAAMAAFLWALIVTACIWRARRNS